MSDGAVACVNGVPVARWLAGKPDRQVELVIDRITRIEGVERLAVMPDVHLSGEVCVGMVIGTRDLILPQAVGGDIGCGIATLALDAVADAVDSPRHAAMVLKLLQQRVPVNRHRKAGELAEVSSDTLSDPSLQRIAERDGAVQLGTLGRGNHFLELQRDADDRLWVMVHSGSRAMGQSVRAFHLRRATEAGGNPDGLDARSASGRDYLADMAWARQYAAANRRAMLEATAALLHSAFAIAANWSTFVDCDHNHVQRESHAGREMWVHRKGASRADAGQTAFIPGSMATHSYHVEGRGQPDSLASSSHGAGRVMSRSEARDRITVRELRAQMRGVWFDPRQAGDLREESPQAYKRIDEVMRAQRDLVKIVRRVEPVISYKGA